LDLVYPKAILIDLDETIISVEGGVDKCWLDVLGKYPDGIDGISADRLMAAIDETRSWYWRDRARHREGRLNLKEARREVVRLAFANLGIADTATANELADAYGTEMDNRTALLPGAMDALRHWQNNRVLLALLTNGSSDIQRRKIHRFRLGSLFKAIVIEGELGCGKPDERVFLHALGQLNVAAGEAWMVGDDLERDIAGAQQLGIFSFWVDSGSRGLPAASKIQPDRIIKSVGELV